MKVLLHNAAARTVIGLWDAIRVSSTPSRPKNAQMTSPPQDTMHVDRKTL